MSNRYVGSRYAFGRRIFRRIGLVLICILPASLCYKDNGDIMDAVEYCCHYASER